MTTREFVEKNKELDCIGNILGDSNRVKIYNRQHKLLAVIYPNKRYHMGVDCAGFECLSEDKQHRLFKLCTEYVFTPIEECKDPAKYKLLFKIGHEEYLNTFKNSAYKPRRFQTDSLLSSLGAKNKFTQAEIDKIKAEYGEDCLDSFE